MYVGYSSSSSESAIARKQSVSRRAIMHIVPDLSEAANWLAELCDQVTEGSGDHKQLLDRLEEYVGKSDDDFIQFLLMLLADKLVREDLISDNEFEEMIGNKIKAVVGEYRRELLFLKRGIIALSKRKNSNFVMEYARSGLP